MAITSARDALFDLAYGAKPLSPLGVGLDQPMDLPFDAFICLRPNTTPSSLARTAKVPLQELLSLAETFSSNRRTPTLSDIYYITQQIVQARNGRLSRRRTGVGSDRDTDPSAKMTDPDRRPKQDSTRQPQDQKRGKKDKKQAQTSKGHDVTFDARAYGASNLDREYVKKGSKPHYDDHQMPRLNTLVREANRQSRYYAKEARRDPAKAPEMRYTAAAIRTGNQVLTQVNRSASNPGDILSQIFVHRRKDILPQESMSNALASTSQSNVAAFMTKVNNGFSPLSQLRSTWIWSPAGAADEIYSTEPKSWQNVPKDLRDDYEEYWMSYRNLSQAFRDWVNDPKVIPEHLPVYQILAPKLAQTPEPKTTPVPDRSSSQRTHQR